MTNKKVKQILDIINNLTIADIAEILGDVKSQAQGEPMDGTTDNDVLDDDPNLYKAHDSTSRDGTKTFDLVLLEIPKGREIAVIKALRIQRPDLSLPRAKDATNDLPFKVLVGVDKNRSESAGLDLETAGAKVLITPS